MQKEVGKVMQVIVKSLKTYLEKQANPDTIGCFCSELSKLYHMVLKSFTKLSYFTGLRRKIEGFKKNR